MSERFYCQRPPDGHRATVEGHEAHHLAHVMRLAAGDEVILFDGSGVEYSARILRIGRDRVELEVFDRRTVDRELPFSLVLGIALPKGDRQRWLVEKLTELGVTRMVPLLTRRGVAQPSPSAIERLRRSVIEASKQCGRNRLMEIVEPTSWQGFLATGSEHDRRIVPHPGSGTSAADVLKLVGVGDSDILLAIGPEGGITPEELDAAVSAGWQAVDLGPRILRVETAAVALAAMFAAAG